MRPRAHRSGFTLVEVLVALTLFSVLGYAVLLALGVGRSSSGAVEDLADESHSVRVASSALQDDLRATNVAHVAIDTLADGNHAVRLQVALDAGGTVAWGVHERALGATAAAQDRAGWFVRYTVVDAAAGGGATEKQLVRQVVDDTGAVRAARTLVRGLRPGASAPRGFGLVRQGGVWEVTLSTVSLHAGQPGMRVVFHAQSRNEST